MNPTNELSAHDWERLARYLANESDADERRAVDAWLAVSETNRHTFRQLQHLYGLRDSPTNQPDPALAWNRYVAPQLTDEAAVRPLHPQPWWQRPFLQSARSWGVAAAVAGLVLGTLWLYRSSTDPDPPQVVQTPVGKRSLLTLPDGSRVWLNADSRLEYPKTFSGDWREVRLVGEAFFDVTHNPRQPFVIRLKTASIRVLGTSFNVRAYPGDAVVKTTVVTGRVAFIPNPTPAQATTPAPDTLFVTPNRHVVQQTDSRVLTEEPVVALNEAAWKDNRLVFDQTPLREVAHTLERWYGVAVVFDKPALANCPLTATFEGQSLREVMDLMTRTGRFTYKLVDKQLTISGPGCAALN